jgi:methionine synthase II (cobalamin-independent)
MTPDKVHLVGSIALDSVEDVFRTVGHLLGPLVRRVPDGEPGGRRMWISWQYPFLRAQPFLKPDPSISSPRGFPPLILAGETEIHFGELGYAREARISYQDFVSARQFGELPPNVRFQVSLPTPFAVINPFISPKDAFSVEGPYEAAVVREVETICRAIPRHDLCIQWDVCIEMLLWDGRWEGRRDPFGSDLHSEILKRMKRLAAAVPADVELGFHLCYGDYDAKHFVEPADAGKLVEIANALATAVTRPIAYFHMPVPIARNDDAYFRPLRDLHLAPKTEVYLGLVHLDGVESTRKRIAAAAHYASDFGVATECGIARLKTPEQVETLLETQRQLAKRRCILIGGLAGLEDP